MSLSFEDKTVRWTSEPAVNVAYPVGEANYEAIEVRQGLLAATINHPESNSDGRLHVDLISKRAVIVHTVMMSGTSTVAERSVILEAGIGGEIGERFEPTKELVGKRIHWTYGPTHFFEHIYMSRDLYVSARRHPASGMGAVEPTSVRKIAESFICSPWSDRGAPSSTAPW